MGLVLYRRRSEDCWRSAWFIPPAVTEAGRFSPATIANCAQAFESATLQLLTDNGYSLDAEGRIVEEPRS